MHASSVTMIIVVSVGSLHEASRCDNCFFNKNSTCHEGVWRRVKGKLYNPIQLIRYQEVSRDRPSLCRRALQHNEGALNGPQVKCTHSCCNCTLVFRLGVEG